MPARSKYPAIAPGKLNVNLYFSKAIFSFENPAAVNRSMTFSLTPHVIGLMNPSGGGSVSGANF